MKLLSDKNKMHSTAVKLTACFFSSRYAIGPGMEELSSVFAVHPTSGWVTLLTPLDRETRSFYNLSVLVWDTPDRLGRKSDMSLTATTSVLITVTDVNDNAPLFQVGAVNLF